MPGRSRFERIGYVFESIGRVAERISMQPKEKDPVRKSVIQACHYLIVLILVFGVVAPIAYIVLDSNLWAIPVLAMGVGSIALAVQAKRTTAPTASFAWLVVALVLTGLTMAGLVLLPK